MPAIKFKLPGGLRRDYHDLTAAQVRARFNLMMELSIKHGVPFIATFAPDKKAGAGK